MQVTNVQDTGFCDWDGYRSNEKHDKNKLLEYHMPICLALRR